jgi:hypothetical protein
MNHMPDQSELRAIAAELIRNAIKEIDSEIACDHVVATRGEAVDVDALAFGSEAAVRAAQVDISWNDNAETGPAEQGSYFWLMVIQTPNAGGLYVNSYQGTWTPSPGATRLGTFNEIRSYIDEQDPRARGGIAVAFDLQPNQL